MRELWPKFYPGGFPFPETTPTLSLSSPPISLPPVRPFSLFHQFRRFRPPSGVQPVTTGAPQPACDTSDLGLGSFGRKSSISRREGDHFA
ncbi:hypothetical protein RchiOBHm_Chr6g0302751 [Rosa chinensis]|uniref:Uncharacterized protein n=1 Tax=Rosa chinensis TaxID=74649 RepID=A0A2P6PPN6_ROSCH|nr:hypothetical protein RchiOBHm_Chr6g0266391 [Rosa chinensis]PRQ27196.1 hypothetical protein RchiOBHm_Chr6g0302751 [Rosa chinensis]